MGRPFRIIVTWLLLGLLTTIAIAWVPALPPFQNLRIAKKLFPRVTCAGPSLPGKASWGFMQQEHLTYTRIFAFEGIVAFRGFPTNAIAPSWSGLPQSPLPDRRDQVQWRMQQEARGWPMRALVATYLNKPRRIGDGHLNVVEGIAIYKLPQRSGSGKEYMALPTRPIWPGLIGNTMLYASLLWLFSGGFRRARKKWRIHGGKCIKCAYDLRGTDHERCPECGWNRETLSDSA